MGTAPETQDGPASALAREGRADSKVTGQDEHTASNRPAQDVRDVLTGQLRDFLHEVLWPVECDVVAARASLACDDDAGLGYHFRRILACVRAAAPAVRRLEALTGRASP